MGRYYYSTKTTTDGLNRLSSSFLNKHGYFCGWKSGTVSWTSNYSKSSISVTVDTSSNKVHLSYTVTNSNGVKTNMDYSVRLVTTPCQYGGCRYWFICPLTINGVPCNRRVGVLYRDGSYFGCRHCHRLTYASRNENRRFNNTYPYCVLGAGFKIDHIMEKMKRPYYAGKPTRLQKQIDKLQGMIDLYPLTRLEDVYYS